MEKNSDLFIQIKIAITLRAILSRNKANGHPIDSYQKIATNSNSDLRKATVSNAFGGQTKTAMTTIVHILNSLGYTTSAFSEVFDNIPDHEVLRFKKQMIDNKE